MQNETKDGRKWPTFFQVKFRKKNGTDDDENGPFFYCVKKYSGNK